MLVIYLSPSDSQIKIPCRSHMGDLINEQLGEFKAKVSFCIKEIFKVSESRNTER